MTLFRKFIPHAVALLLMLVIAAIYAAPALEGKKLNLHDTTQAMAGAREVQEYHRQTGEWSAWSNAMFSGMPAFLIAGDYPNSLSTKMGRWLNALPDPIDYIWLQMLGMYVLLIALRASPWQALLGAVAYAFASYNIISIKAGHLSKNLALAYAPAVLAGVVWALRGRYWLGGAVTALFLGLELYGNHLQITYYLALALGVYYLMEAWHLARTGRTRQLLTASGVLAVAALLAVGTHATRLWNIQSYSKHSTRGRSELTQATTGQATAAAGLDKDYAFNWSYGKLETLNLLIPNFYGGSSNGGLSTGSETYKAMTAAGIDPTAAKQFVESGVPAYWGSQPGTGGPAYAGAVVLFLFVLGMALIRHRIRWWLLGFAGLYTMLAWGKNFELLTTPFFDYFPGFNKFRAITMLLSVVPMFLGVGAVLGVKALTDRRPAWAELKRPLAISLALTAGLCLLFALLPGAFLDFRMPTTPDPQTGVSTGGDTAVLTQVFGDPNAAAQMLRPLLDDRQSLLRADAFRSLVFILLAAGLVAGFVFGKIRSTVLALGLAALALIDLAGVDKRYFNNNDFISKSEAEQVIVATPADEQILQDKGHYRVLDNTTNFISDARASYFHHSVGGYHGAKLRRYQDLIEYAFQKNFLNILNMLNVKYILQVDKNNQPMVQQNPGAYGPAWFVKNYTLVPNADAEMKAMQTLDPRQTAVVDERFAPQLNGLKLQYDSTATVRLTDFKPNQWTYQTTAASPQLAVFSEIYYDEPADWQVTLDGRPVPHLRADYVLRALPVPAGSHKIVFRFDPVSVRQGNTIDLIASVLLALFVAGALFFEFRRPRGEGPAAADRPGPDGPAFPPRPAAPGIRPGKNG